MKNQLRSEFLKVIIIGHVDHGKSTLVGKLLSDLKQIPDEKISEIRKICQTRSVEFEWAFLLDALKTERDQGITIDTTQIFFKTSRRNYVIIDAPGHAEFLKNMITGATFADLSILIIDAFEGIKEQTKKHIYLLGLLGVRNVIVVINKMDLLNYDENKYLIIRSEIEKYLKLINVVVLEIIPVSARAGFNVVNKNTYNWYNGKTLIDTLDSFNKEKEDLEKPLRYVVQDIYKIEEKRILVGRIESGKIFKSKEYLVSPSKSKVTIKSFQLWPATKRDFFVEGECIGIELNEKIFVEKGNVISAPDTTPILSNNFEARIFWFSEKKLVINKKYKIKINTSNFEIIFTNIEKVINVEDLSEKKTNVVERNNVADVFVNSESIICIDNFEFNKKTGCFSIIDEFEVAGGGIIKRDRDLQENVIKTKYNENVKSESFFINEIDRVLKVGHRPGILWLTGLSGSGKSTIAKEVEKKLFFKGYNVFVLDGDNLRQGLNSDLDFLKKGRTENIRRTAEVASLFVSAGFIVITSLISPYKIDRKKARSIRSEVFKEIFIKASLQKCEERDVKGLYAKARDGVIKNFTGLTAPYEEPENPDLVINTENKNIFESTKILENFVEKEFGKN